MRAENCAGCVNFDYDRCKLKQRPIIVIKGCSQSASGRVFFRSKSGAEKLRRDVIAPKMQKGEVTK